MANSERRAEDDAEAEQPRAAAARLFRHILTKGLQLGSVVGSAMLLPSLYYFKTDAETHKLPKFVTHTMMGGVALSGTLGLAKFAAMDTESVQDRAYRIKYNAAQNRLDRMNTVFGLFGASAMGIINGPDTYSILFGFSIGTATAVLAHICTAREKTDVGKIVHELKH